jgi:hypothetical protein
MSTNIVSCIPFPVKEYKYLECDYVFTNINYSKDKILQLVFKKWNTKPLSKSISYTIGSDTFCLLKTDHMIQQNKSYYRKISLYKKIHNKNKMPNIVSDTNFMLYEIYNFYVKILDTDMNYLDGEIYI